MNGAPAAARLEAAQLEHETSIHTEETFDVMRKSIALFVAVIGIAAGNAPAQEGALSRLYGQGVHAYFGGNRASAEKLFSQAINAGSQDPRLHYFRGLIYLQAGRNQAADAEFEKGAALEVGAIRDYHVSRSLERVQGRPRIALEQRRAARLAEGSSATQAYRRERIERIQRREAETTIPARPSRFDEITGDAVPRPAVQPEVATPFADPMEAAPADAGAATDLDDAAGQPFGAEDALPADTDTPPADEGADEVNPFGGNDDMPADDATPADPIPADEVPAADTAPAADTTPPADDTENPFDTGEETPPADEPAPIDPGTPPSDEPPPADEGANPFDDATPTSTDETPAPSDETPAPTDEAPADEENPFGS